MLCVTPIARSSSFQLAPTQSLSTLENQNAHNDRFFPNKRRGSSQAACAEYSPSPDRSMTNDVATVPQTRDKPLEFKIDKILVPLDFSPASMEALGYAVSLAKQFHAAIHLVHVYPSDEASSVPGAGHLLFQSAEAIERLNEELTGIHSKHVPTFR